MRLKEETRKERELGLCLSTVIVPAIHPVQALRTRTRTRPCSKANQKLDQAVVPIIKKALVVARRAAPRAKYG